METIEESIKVDAPLQAVYNQWTQFETFPQFMEGVESVTQLDAKRLHWVAKVAGKQKEWDAEIFEQVPDQRIAWRSTSGAQNSGRVIFTPESVNETRITLQLHYSPEGALEHIGDMLGIVKARVHGDLKRFKALLESQQSATGAWRGEIRGREVDPTPQSSVRKSSTQKRI